MPFVSFTWNLACGTPFLALKVRYSLLFSVCYDSLISYTAYSRILHTAERRAISEAKLACCSCRYVNLIPWIAPTTYESFFLHFIYLSAPSEKNQLFPPLPNRTGGWRREAQLANAVAKRKFKNMVLITAMSSLINYFIALIMRPKTPVLLRRLQWYIFPGGPGCILFEWAIQCYKLMSFTLQFVHRLDSQGLL